MRVQTLFAALTKNDETDRWSIRDDIAEELHDDVQGIIWELHDNGAILPDDYRYRFIAEAASQLADGWGLSDIQAQDPDDRFPYTSDRLQWLASRLDRIQYVDDARLEYNDGGSTAYAIGLGMCTEYDEVAAALASICEV